MNKADYQRYLAGREWAVLREQIRERSGGACERCTTGRHEQTHHVTYERLGTERLEDLLGVCEPCHLFLSGKSDDDPVTEEIPDLGDRIDRRGFLSCFCGEERMEFEGKITAHPDLECVGLYAKCKRGHQLAITLVASGFAFIGIDRRRELGKAGR